MQVCSRRLLLVIRYVFEYLFFFECMIGLANDIWAGCADDSSRREGGRYDKGGYREELNYALLLYAYVFYVLG